MRRGLWLLVLAVLITHFSMAYAASVPALVNYQGKLTDATGAELATGEYDLYFRIWNDPMADVIASNLVWGEKHVKVPVVRGMFNVILGGGTPLAGLIDAQKDIAQAFNGSARYVGIAVGSADMSMEIKPRQQILSTPFALTADNGTPVGGIIPFYSFEGAVAVPDGYAVCDGSIIDPVKYANSPLKGKNTPDLRGRFLRGAPEGDEPGRLVQGTASTGNRSGGTDLNSHQHQLPLFHETLTDFSVVPKIATFGTSDTSITGDVGFYSGGGSRTGKILLSDSVYTTKDLNAHTHSLTNPQPDHFTVIYIVRVR